MRHPRTTTQASPATRRTDAGFSLVEVLMAVTLMGIGMVGVIAATGVAAVASSTSRDHAKAHEWLQTASEVLVHNVAWKDCSVGLPALTAFYQEQLRADATGATPPEGWEPEQLEVLSGAQPDEQVLFGAPGGGYSTTCNTEINRQLVRLRVRNADGKIVENVDVVVTPTDKPPVEGTP